MRASTRQCLKVLKGGIVLLEIVLLEIVLLEIVLDTQSYLMDG